MRAGHRAALPYAQPKPADVGETYDPGAHTVSEVQGYVSAHPDQLAQVYQDETAGKARSSLLAWLEAR